MEKMIVVMQQVGLPIEEVDVSSLDDASKKVVAWQNSRGLGASNITTSHGVVRIGGRFHARISYNGKITNTPIAREQTIKRMVAEVMAKTMGGKR